MATEPEVSIEDVRRLARELAARRDAAYAEVKAEVELLKASLRERAAAIAERERELDGLERRPGAGVPPTDFADAQRLKRRAESELRLAEAERAKLDEREQQIHAVERELATLRRQLAGRPEQRPAETDRERELERREAAVAARERALAERERLGPGETVALPPPPSFSEGLAALARERTR